jgi:hypothetical protein
MELARAHNLLKVTVDSVEEMNVDDILEIDTGLSDSTTVVIQLVPSGSSHNE